MVKIESLDKLAGGLRAKFLRDEIELLRKRTGAQGSGTYIRLSLYSRINCMS